MGKAMASSDTRRLLHIDRAVNVTVFTLKNIPTVLRLVLMPALIALAIRLAFALGMPVQAINFLNVAEAERIMNGVRQLFLIPSILLASAGAILKVGIL
jgi:hypothetical protein